MDYSQLSASDLALTCLKDGEEHAWIEFVRRFQPLIASVVLRTARTWSEPSKDIVDDLVQETFLKICAERVSLAANFRPEYPDAIFGYIRALTTNLVHDYFRATNSLKRGKNVTIPLSFESPRENPSCNVPPESFVEHAILISQIDRYIRELDTPPNSNRDREIFWLHYRVGLSARAIAGISRFRLSTKGVESTLFRLTKHVKAKLCSQSLRSTPERLQNKGITGTETLSRE